MLLKRPGKSEKWRKHCNESTVIDNSDDSKKKIAL